MPPSRPERRAANKGGGQRPQTPQPNVTFNPAVTVPAGENAQALEKVPVTYGDINEYYTKLGQAQPVNLRLETIRRIEAITKRPLICYVSKTHDVPPGVDASIEDFDIVGFGDLVNSLAGKGPAIDVLIVSNGGTAEAAERIVRLLHDKFESVRFIIPSNAFSAATMISFSGEEILMDSIGTLGPIDPQFRGVPARSIVKAFRDVEERLKTEGPQALTAYLPLINKYDLYIFEICRNAEELSKELAKTWLSSYMFNCGKDDPRVTQIVDNFSTYDLHLSHGRSIGREQAKALGLNIKGTEEVEGLADLVRSLYNQYEFLFNATPFYKMFENAYGVSWGRQAQQIAFQIPNFGPNGPAPTQQFVL